MTGARRVASRAPALALGALLALGVGMAWHWRHLFDPLSLAAAIERHPAAPLVFLAVHVMASLFFVPRTLLAFAAGLAFGMWWGIVWAAAGSVAGAVAGFLAARYIYAGAADRIERGRLRTVLERVDHGGWRMVALVRLVPILPHSLTNYALGLTRLGVGAYALGSLLGQLPLTVAYADLGAAGAHALSGAADWRHQVLWPSAIGVSALGLSLLVPALLRRREQQAGLLPPNPPMPPA
ncbi:MAG: TVP38/TMEM64 family protein [Thiohalocapsa sp.]